MWFKKTDEQKRRDFMHDFIRKHYHSNHYDSTHRYGDNDVYMSKSNYSPMQAICDDARMAWGLITDNR